MTIHQAPKGLSDISNKGLLENLSGTNADAVDKSPLSSVSPDALVANQNFLKWVQLISDKTRKDISRIFPLDDIDDNTPTVANKNFAPQRPTTTIDSLTPHIAKEILAHAQAA